MGAIEGSQGQADRRRSVRRASPSPAGCAARCMRTAKEVVKIDLKNRAANFTIFHHLHPHRKVCTRLSLAVYTGTVFRPRGKRCSTLQCVGTSPKYATGSRKELVHSMSLPHFVSPRYATGGARSPLTTARSTNLLLVARCSTSYRGFSGENRGF